MGMSHGGYTAMIVILSVCGGLSVFAAVVRCIVVMTEKEAGTPANPENAGVSDAGKGTSDCSRDSDLSPGEVHVVVAR